MPFSVADFIVYYLHPVQSQSPLTQYVSRELASVTASQHTLQNNLHIVQFCRQWFCLPF